MVRCGTTDARQRLRGGSSMAGPSSGGGWFPRGSGEVFASRRRRVDITAGGAVGLARSVDSGARESPARGAGSTDPGFVARGALERELPKNRAVLVPAPQALARRSAGAHSRDSERRGSIPQQPAEPGSETRHPGAILREPFNRDRAFEAPPLRVYGRFRGRVSMRIRTTAILLLAAAFSALSARGECADGPRSWVPTEQILAPRATARVTCGGVASRAQCCRHGRTQRKSTITA